MKLLKFTTTIVLSMIVSLSFAQHKATVNADNAYNNDQYYEAIELYKDAYSKEKSVVEKRRILAQVGICYYNLQDNKNAQEWLEKAKKAGAENNNISLMLAKILQKEGQYAAALKEFEDYVGRVPNDTRGTLGVESCKLAIELTENPTRYEVSPEPLINSERMDFSPTWSGKKWDELFITSTRESANGNDVDPITGQNFSSVFATERDKNDRWVTPTPLGETINAAESNDGSAAMNKRRNTIYFTRCKYEKKGVLGCAIYTARKRGNDFDVAELVPLTENDTAAIGHPSVGLDDMYMFFASDIPGTYGGKDIWFSKYDKKAKQWGPPINCGEEVNTTEDEMFPFIHPNGTLYFASTGHPGMGGYDIFSAERTADDKWGNPQNVGSPINSSANDLGLIFEGNKQRGFLTTDREGGEGSFDVWSFRFPPLKFIIAGKIYNLETGEVIPNATIALKGTDGTAVEIQSDELGYYEFDQKEGSAERYVDENTSYTMTVSKEKYLVAKGQETTVDVNVSTKFVHDFRLQPITEKAITFPEVRYDLAKAELQVNDVVNSKDSLDYLYQTLIDNPTIVIELMAHTDSRGKDAANLDLSQRRAQSCVAYLQSKGIDPERMVAKGYGETQLKITDAEIAALPTKEDQEAAHQKNRRTEFRVLRDDFVPKEVPTPETGEEGVPDEE